MSWLLSIIIRATALAGKALGVVASVARQYPWQCALVVSVLMTGWFYRQSDLWERAYHLEHKARLAFTAEIADRIRESAEAARSARIEKEYEYERKAEAQDATIADLRQRYRSSVMRMQAAQRSRSDPGTGAEGGDTEVHGDAAPGGGVPQGSMIVSVADAFLCADATAYAMKAYEWAKSLGEPKKPGLTAPIPPPQ